MTRIELCHSHLDMWRPLRIERDQVCIAMAATICIEKERKKVSLSEINVDWLFSIRS